MTTNQQRAVEAIVANCTCNFCEVLVDPGETCPHCRRDATQVAQALAEAGLLRPDPSDRHEGVYRTEFHRHEESADGACIDAAVGSHNPAPTYERVQRAEVSVDIGGEYGFHVMRVHATAEWCREAAAVLLDVADEVDRKNQEVPNV